MLLDVAVLYNAYDIIAVLLYIHNGVIYMCPNEWKYFWIYFDLLPHQDGVDYAMVAEQYALIFDTRSCRLRCNNRRDYIITVTV